MLTFWKRFRETELLLVFRNESRFCCCFPKSFTAWKVSKYGVISGSYFPVFGLNKSPYSVRIQENMDKITLYLDTFHAVISFLKLLAYRHMTIPRKTPSTRSLFNYVNFIKTRVRTIFLYGYFGTCSYQWKYLSNCFLKAKNYRLRKSECWRLKG